MLLDLADALKHPGDSYPFLAVGGLPRDMLPEGVELVGDVRLSGLMTALSDEVAVIGNIEARISLPCARCLTPVTIGLSLEYGETLKRAGLEAQETEPDADEPEAVFFEGTSCDIERQVAGALLLELPMRALCEDSCKGLCPVCGADLNDAPCDCRPPADSPFAALAGLKIDDDSDKEV